MFVHGLLVLKEEDRESGNATDNVNMQNSNMHVWNVTNWLVAGSDID